MKYSIFLIFFSVLSFHLFAQGVGINDDGGGADPSAILDLDVTNRGFLMPRMTEQDKLSINNPVQSLIVYQTDGQQGFYYFYGSSWRELCSMPS